MRTLLDCHRVVHLPARFHSDRCIVVSVTQTCKGIRERDIFAVVGIDEIKRLCRYRRVPGAKLIGDVRVLKARLIDDLRRWFPCMSYHVCLARVMTVIASGGSSAAASTRGRQLPLLRITEKELLVGFEVVVEA